MQKRKFTHFCPHSPKNPRPPSLSLSSLSLPIPSSGATLAGDCQQGSGSGTDSTAPPFSSLSSPSMSLFLLFFLLRSLHLHVLSPPCRSAADVGILLPLLPWLRWQQIEGLHARFLSLCFLGFWAWIQFQKLVLHLDLSFRNWYWIKPI